MSGSVTAWLTARPIAHRGYHDAGAGRVENTLPAFAAAVARNFAIECDVRLAADGGVVVFHDATLNRLTDAVGEIRQMTVRELQAVRFHGAAAAIPTLGALLGVVRGTVPLVIELKSDATRSGQTLAGAVAAGLAGYAGPVAVMSFEPSTMIAMRRAAPQYPRGMIVDRFMAADNPQLSAVARFAARHLLAAPLVEPQFVACDVHRLPALVPGALRGLGRPLLTWTVRQPAERAAARAWADQIIFEGFDPDA